MTVSAEHREALLIGNATCRDRVLPSPRADIEALAASLTRRGFRTNLHHDLDRKRLGPTLERFAQGVPTGGTALVYYSGHILQGQRNGKQANVFLPVDSSHLDFEARDSGEYSVAELLELLHTTGGGSCQIVLIDVASGLSRTGKLPPKSLLGSSARPGQVIAPSAAKPRLASRLTELLDRPGGMIEAIETASVWSLQTLETGTRLPATGSIAISAPATPRLGTKAGDEWVNARGMVFCWCPPGKHTAGFWLGKFKLTRRDSRLFSRKGIASENAIASDKNHPMDRIPPRKIGAYLKALNEAETQAGRLPARWEYSLPTEVEWEYACRAGTTTRFYFGDDRSFLPLHGNFADRSLLGYSYTATTLDDKTPLLARVGTYRANAWGFHDMYGNLWEFVGTPGTKEHVARGGSWVSVAGHCSSLSRLPLEETSGANRPARNFLGYRLILRPKP
jgi:hypothetical protein